MWPKQPAHIDRNQLCPIADIDFAAPLSRAAADRFISVIKLIRRWRSKPVAADQRTGKNNFLVLAQYVEGNGLVAIERHLERTHALRPHFSGPSVINLRFFPSEVE